MRNKLHAMNLSKVQSKQEKQKKMKKKNKQISFAWINNSIYKLKIYPIKWNRYYGDAQWYDMMNE